MIAALKLGFILIRANDAETPRLFVYCRRSQAYTLHDIVELLGFYTCYLIATAAIP